MTAVFDTTMLTPDNCGLVQFLNWIIVERDGVPTKVPVSPKTGFTCDPHDPAHWTTYQDAAARGNVAFVLTDNDPFFFLDLDKCRPNGIWTPEANLIAQPFINRGAFIEISQSGSGLHVLGTMSPMGVAILRNKWDGWLEFYFSKRFVALGSDWQGDMRIDCTDLVYQLVPQRDPNDLAELTGQRDPEWSGPEDDAKLIARMLSSAGGTGSAFGAKAHVRDLWTADTLERFWPVPEDRSDGLKFDWSSADAALMSHLAFWTGKDGPRMDRLFRQSALMRDKFDKRSDYRKRTINGAIQRCNKVYQGRGEVSAGAREGPQNTGAVVPTTGHSEYPETIDLSQIEQYFSGCTYVEDRHQVLTPDGRLLKPEQFKVRYGGHRFMTSRYETSTPTKDAFEAFTQNRAIKFPAVRTTCFLPDVEPYAIVETENGTAVNMFDLPEIVTSDADPTPFLGLIARLLPDQRDQQILLSWMSFCMKHRGRKALWAIVLQGVEGNGKSFIRKALQYAIGERLTHCPNSEDMSEKYNGYVEHTLFVAVEEVHMEGRRSMMDRLKPLITEDRIEIRAMNTDKYMAANLTNWMFMSNHRDAVIKTTNDRRYAVFFTAQQFVDDLERDGMTPEYFRALWDWARAGGFAAIAGYLERYEGPAEFDPAREAIRAPKTSSTDAAVFESLGPMEREIVEAIDNGEAGFRNGWISSEMVRQLLSNIGRPPNRRVMSNVITGLGYVRMGKTAPLIHEGGRQVTVYRRKNDPRPVRDYPDDQGYPK